MLRQLKGKEATQRGCLYCAHMKLEYVGKGRKRTHCPFRECPYHELDNVKRYTDYLKNTENGELIKLLGI